MNERMSAFIDGELSDEECGPAIVTLRNDDRLRRAWDTYHLIGDILRGESRRSYSDAVIHELASEPTIIAAPRPVTRMTARPPAFFLRVAAGAAAVVLVALLALPMMSSGPEVAPPVLEASASAELPKGVEEYVLAHQRFSPSGVIQGLARDVRQVSAEASGESR